MFGTIIIALLLFFYHKSLATELRYIAVVSIGIVLGMFFDNTKEQLATKMIIFIVIVSSVGLGTQVIDLKGLFFWSELLFVLGLSVFAPLRGAARGACFAIISFIIICLEISYLKTVSADLKFMLFLIFVATMSIFPMAIEFEKGILEGPAWRFLIVQQTILRAGIIIWALSFKPIYIDTNLTEIFPLVFLIAAVCVFLVAVFFHKIFIWSVIQQSLLSLFFAYAAVWQDRVALIILAIGAAVNFITQMSPIAEMKSDDQKQNILQTLESGGVGGAQFFLGLVVLWQLKNTVPFYQQFVWLLLYFLFGLLLWIKSGKAWIRQKEMRATNTIINLRLIFQIACVLLLAIVMKIFVVMGGMGTNV